MIDSQLCQLLASGTSGIVLNISAKDLKEIVTLIMHNEHKRADEEAEKSREIPTLTRNDVAKMIGVTPKTLYLMAKREELIPIKIGVKVRYRLSDVEEYLHNNRQTI